MFNRILEIGFLILLMFSTYIDNQTGVIFNGIMLLYIQGEANKPNKGE